MSAFYLFFLINFFESQKTIICFKKKKEKKKKKEAKISLISSFALETNKLSYSKKSSRSSVSVLSSLN